MNALIAQLQAEREEQTSYIATMLEGVEGRDLSDTERETLTRVEARIVAIDEQIAPLASYESRKASAVKVSGIAAPAASRRPELFETRSLGELFTESEQFRAYNGHGTSQVLEVAEFRAVGPDPLLTSGAPGSKLVASPEKIRGADYYAAFPLLSLVGRIEVAGNSVSYVTTSDATGADVVAEGAQKPAVAWTATETPYTLETIAGWFKFSRQSLSDIPQLQSLIDQKIRRSIDSKLNALAVAALGGAFSGGNTITGASGKELVELVRLAIASLNDLGITPTAVLANPADIAAYDIAMLGKPLGVASVNGGMWGLPLIPVSGVAAGTAVVGDISSGLVYFQKAGLEMFTTDSDVSGEGATAKSDFRANILTTLGEVRGKFAAVDAQVLRKVVVTP